MTVIHEIHKITRKISGYNTAAEAQNEVNTQKGLIPGCARTNLMTLLTNSVASVKQNSTYDIIIDASVDGIKDIIPSFRTCLTQKEGQLPNKDSLNDSGYSVVLANSYEKQAYNLSIDITGDMRPGGGANTIAKIKGCLQQNNFTWDRYSRIDKIMFISTTTPDKLNGLKMCIQNAIDIPFEITDDIPGNGGDIPGAGNGGDIPGAGNGGGNGVPLPIIGDNGGKIIDQIKAGIEANKRVLIIGGVCAVAGFIVWQMLRRR